MSSPCEIRMTFDLNILLLSSSYLDTCSRVDRCVKIVAGVFKAVAGNLSEDRRHYADVSVQLNGVRLYCVKSKFDRNRLYSIQLMECASVRSGFHWINPMEFGRRGVGRVLFVMR